MRFRFNNLLYDVPGVVEEIAVRVDDEHADFNFIVNGEDAPMLGGVDENGDAVPTWEDLGIRRVPEKDAG